MARKHLGKGVFIFLWYFSGESAAERDVEGRRDGLDDEDDGFSLCRVSSEKPSSHVEILRPKLRISYSISAAQGMCYSLSFKGESADMMGKTTCMHACTVDFRRVGGSSSPIPSIEYLGEMSHLYHTACPLATVLNPPIRPASEGGERLHGTNPRAALVNFLSGIQGLKPALTSRPP